MATLTKIAKTSDVPKGSSKTIDLDNKSVALFNIDGIFYATDNTCPHMGGPLGDGFIEGTVTTCPWHGWQFDVETGLCVADADTKVSTYPVTVEGDDVLISI